MAPLKGLSAMALATIKFLAKKMSLPTLIEGSNTRETTSINT